jgi:hypothetical protein
MGQLLPQRETLNGSLTKWTIPSTSGSHAGWRGAVGSGCDVSGALGPSNRFTTWAFIAGAGRGATRRQPRPEDHR